MHFLFAALPEFLGALGSAAVIGMLLWCGRRVRSLTRHGTATAAPPIGNVALGPDRRGIDLAKVRRYTLLDTATDNGLPIQVTTTRPAGTLITQALNGQERRFELTDVRLHDGTFAAEPIDRCVPRW